MINCPFAVFTRVIPDENVLPKIYFWSLKPVLEF